MRRLLFVVFILFTFSVVFVHAQAPSPGAGVVISLSEVSGCQENEWIELYNNSDQDVSLNAWKIEKTSPANQSKTLEATISAKTYKKVWEGSSFLTKSGFTLQLKDSDGTVLESNAFAACPSNTAVSWIKQGTAWLFTTTQTPGQENTHTPLTTPTPTPTPSATSTPSPTSTATPSPTTAPTATPGTQPTTISLSEVYACQADGSKEWVELYNSGAATTLTNWKLTDDDNNEQPIASLAMGAKAYSVVEISKYARGMLTNDGDVVNLIDGTGKKVDSYEYKGCHTDQTWAKVGGTWQETVQITRGSANPSTGSVSLATTAPDSAILEGDGGGGTGEVLGSSDEESEASPSPTPKPVSSSGQTTIAIASISLGLFVLAAIGGYFGWEWWKKRKKKKL